MFFVENERAGGNLVQSFHTVDSDESRIKRPTPIQTNFKKIRRTQR